MDMNRSSVLKQGEFYDEIWFDYKEYMGNVPHGRWTIYDRSQLPEPVDKIWVRGKKVYSSSGERLVTSCVRFRGHDVWWKLTYKPNYYTVYRAKIGANRDIDPAELIVTKGWDRKEIHRRRVLLGNKQYSYNLMMDVVMRMIDGYNSM